MPAAWDGSLFPAYVPDTPIREAAGEMVGFIGVSVDISLQKASEAALAESRELYRLVVDNSLDMILLADMEGRIRFASPSHLRSLGRAAAASTQKRLS